MSFTPAHQVCCVQLKHTAINTIQAGVFSFSSCKKRETPQSLVSVDHHLRVSMICKTVADKKIRLLVLFIMPLFIPGLTP